MASIQRKFAACLITLFMVSSIGYTGPTKKQTPDDCNEDCNLANQIRGCLNTKGIEFDNVSVINGNIEVVLKANKETPVPCNRIVTIIECANKAVNYERGHDLAISIAPSTPGTTAYYVYKGHTGTGTIPDCLRLSRIDVLDLKSIGTLNINTCKVERKVSEDAKRLGVRIENLNVKVKKSEDGKLYLQVSGKVRASEVSESQVIVMVKDLVEKYTGTPRINTDKLEVYPRIGKDSRIK